MIIIIIFMGTMVPRGDTTGPGEDLSQQRPSNCFVCNVCHDAHGDNGHGDHGDGGYDDDHHGDVHNDHAKKGRQYNETKENNKDVDDDADKD